MSLPSIAVINGKIYSQGESVRIGSGNQKVGARIVSIRDEIVTLNYRGRKIEASIRRKETIKDAAGVAVGNHVKVKIVKNKVAPPFAEAEFDIIYNHGINKEGSILDVGIECGVVDKKGAWLQFEGELIGQGKEAAQKALAEKPELAAKIVGAIMTKRRATATA